MALNIQLAPYQLNEISSKDTFLIHYSATDNTGAKFNISEFFPQYMVSRSDNGAVIASERFVNEFELTLERFKKGCAMIQGLSDASFNPIIDVADNNNTAYMVRRECSIPSLSSYMGGLKMDFYEAYQFIRPLLMFLSQAARSEVHFIFSLEDMHVNNKGQLILDKAFTLDTPYSEAIADIVKIYYYLIVGEPYDPANPSPKAHGVTLPTKLDNMMAGALSGESLYGGVDDFSKNLKFIVEQERDSGGEDEGGEKSKPGSLLRWMVAGLTALLITAVAFLMIFVLIPGYRRARPDLTDPALLSTPAPAPTAEAGRKSSRDFSALAVTNPSDAADVLEGAFTGADGEIYLRSYKNGGYHLAKRAAAGNESELLINSQPSFLTEHGGDVYFSDGQNGNIILRVNTDSGGGEIFADNCALYLCIKDDYLYYTNHDDLDRMYRKNVYTLDEELYVRAAAYETVTDGDKIYFINGGDNFTVYSAAEGEGGAALTRLNNENSRNLCYSDGTLFYTTADGSVRAMTTGGRQIETGCETKARTLEASGGRLAITEEGTNRVKVFDLNTKETVSLGGTAKAAYAWINEDEVFAVSYDDCAEFTVYDQP